MSCDDDRHVERHRETGADATPPSDGVPPVGDVDPRAHPVEGKSRPQTPQERPHRRGRERAADGDVGPYEEAARQVPD